MNLPSSEPLPNDIHDLPPARQRHIRRQPRSASLAERQILLDSLFQQTSPTLNFILLSLLGVIALGAALYFDELAILIIAVVLLPILRPTLGFSLSPTSRKFGYGLKALVSLLMLFILTFSAGAAAGWLRQTPLVETAALTHLTYPYWLNLTILAVSAFFSALVLLREGQLPRQIGIILSYQILIPLALAGFGFVLGDISLWPNSMFISLLHLGVGIVLANLTFLLFGFVPKHALGWLLTILSLVVTLALLAGTLNLSSQQGIVASEPTPTHTATLPPTLTPMPTNRSTHTPTEAILTATKTLKPSLTASQTQPPTQTPTLVPTSYSAVVDSLNGAVIRAEPSFDAPVVGYVNNGDQIEIIDEITIEGGSRWFHVRTASGEIGWLLGSLVNTQTPAP